MRRSSNQPRRTMQPRWRITTIAIMVASAVLLVVLATSVSSTTAAPSAAFIAVGTRTRTRRVRSAELQSSLSSSSSLAEDAPHPPWGGDYAGLMATFDAHTGKLIPIPEHYIPQSLLEWGQVPSALEVLVSEEEDQQHHPSTTTTTTNTRQEQWWKRQSLCILPETGCGVDNLETIREEEPQIMMMDRKLAASWSSRTNNHPPQEGYRIETAFRMFLANDDDKRENPHRTRISIDLALVVPTTNSTTTSNNNEPKIIQPTQIRIFLERQIQTQSTGGTVAKGGGLDGQSVARWMGPLLSSRSMQSFAAETDPYGAGSSSSSTKHNNSNNSNNSNNNDDGILHAMVLGSNNRSRDAKQVSVHNVWLPANATVQYIRDSTQPEALSVAVGQVQVDSNQEDFCQWVIHHLVVQNGTIVVDKRHDVITEPRRRQQ